MLDETLEIVARHSNPPLPVAFDEWNTYFGAKAPDFIEPYDVADALYAGALMNACIQRCDRISMTAIYNLINVMGNYLVTPLYTWRRHPSSGNYWAGQVVEPVVPPMVVKAPTTLVMELLTHHRGRSESGARSKRPPSRARRWATSRPSTTYPPFMRPPATTPRR